jgi:hypothetical protein
MPKTQNVIFFPHLDVNENVLFFTQKILISKKTIEVYLTVTSNNTILQLMKPY